MRWLPAAALIGLLAAACGTSGGEGARSVEGPGVYLALGDSLSEGVGASVRGETDFVSLVAEGLPGEVELRNLAESGDTSRDLLQHGHVDQAVAEIRERNSDGDSHNDAKLVTLEIGGNDLLDLYFSLVMTGRCPALTAALAEAACVSALREALDGFRMNFANAVRALQEAGPDVQLIVMTLYNPFSGGGLATIDELAEVALEGKEGTPFPEGLNDIIRAEAAESEVTLVDWYPLFDGKASEYIAFDFIHPNDEGYGVMAEAVLDAVR